MDNLMNNRNIMKMEQQKMNLKNSKRHSQLSDNYEDDEDKFSDDSLEDTSLPPPAPPPIVVPPPPSLSAPVTPSKRHSIAWEVNLDDLCSNGNGFSTKVEFFISLQLLLPPLSFSLSTLLRVILPMSVIYWKIFSWLVYAEIFEWKLNFVYWHRSNSHIKLCSTIVEVKADEKKKVWSLMKNSRISLIPVHVSCPL